MNFTFSLPRTRYGTDLVCNFCGHFTIHIQYPGPLFTGIDSPDLHAGEIDMNLPGMVEACPMTPGFPGAANNVTFGNNIRRIASNYHNPAPALEKYRTDQIKRH
jgi:hypothetical protein